MANILIVEDEMLVALDIRNILQGLGHQVLGMVDSGEEALGLVEEGRPDLVLMDIVIKGSLGGIKTAEVIRDRFEIPVIFLTAYSDDPIIEQAMRTDPFGYVLKPFVTKELKITIEMALYKSKTDRQIKEGAARYQELADSITDVFFALDKDLRYVYWNKASEQLTDIPAREALGRYIQDLFPDTPERSAVEKIYREVIKTQSPVNFGIEFPLKKKNCFFEINAYPTRDGLAVISKDITELIKIEDQLRHSQEMKLFGQLAAGVAHEVRNPLNAILAITEALFKDIGHNPEYQPYLDHIRDQVNRLAVLMKDLLELGKPVKLETFSDEVLGEILLTVCNLWEGTDKHKSFPLSLELPLEAANAYVKTDHIRFQQAFLNLLDNAAQNSPKGSRIQIRLQELTSKSCKIRVVDQGKGIPAEYLSRVFDPFFTTRKKGTGLGLNLVKGFIESMGGKVAIWNNDPPPGCTVEVTLPIVEKLDRP